LNRVTPLACTTLVSLSRFDHPPGPAHADPDEEGASDFSVNFLESGSFDLRVGRSRHALDCSTVFVTWPGLAFRCAHQDEAPTDVCLSTSVASAYAEEVWGITGLAPSKARPVVRLTNRLAYLRHCLFVEGVGLDPLAVETLGGDLLAVAIGPEPAMPRRLFRPRQLGWYAARVSAARERLETQYAEPLSLLDLARDVGMSPYHFARVFRELEGVPPHRLLRRVRLQQAARRLRQGARVTDACFSTGFSNLSHFIRSFRRAFGVSPSRFHG
jgi:AraC family transcriptional regulator